MSAGSGRREETYVLISEHARQHELGGPLHSNGEYLFAVQGEEVGNEIRKSQARVGLIRIKTGRS
jgi:hypothetical protein